MEAETARQSKQKPADTSVSWPRHLVWRMPFALLGGLLLRLWMMSAFPQVSGDALIYGNVARNIMLRGQFALSDGSGVPHLTLIRLPGYPFFLAACFRIFGPNHSDANYSAVAYLQIALELAACLLLADFVRRISTPRAGLNTLWLAAMCPFTAVYASAPISESLTFDMICLALWSLERHLSRHRSPARASAFLSQARAAAFLSVNPEGNMLFPVSPNKSSHLQQYWPLALFTTAISTAALLRPDGALLAIALWPALLFTRNKSTPLKSTLKTALLCALVAILPFAFWTARNWRVFHVFEPLAPRYANDPGEDPHLGWQHWVKTWCLDFTCTNDIYWNVPDNEIDLAALPPQAFDSAAQQSETAALFSAYNQNYEIPPELDARFEALARERAATHPLRTYLLLPLARLADMTFRPRVENLTIDLRWWEYWNHKPETRFSYAYAAVNALYLLLGLIGLCLRPRLWPYMAAYLILRSLLLMTIEAPETRYTLEFFPIIFAMAGISLPRIMSKKRII